MNNLQGLEYLPEFTIFLILLFALTALGAVVGNLLVIYIILTSNGGKMRTVTNYYLLNLSLGDLFVVFHIVPNVYFAIKHEWIFGQIYCSFAQFFTAFNMAISVFTFIGVTANRYTAIMYPLRPKPRARVVIAVLALIWLASICVGLPGLLYAKIFTRNVKGRVAVPTNATGLGNNFSSSEIGEEVLPIGKTVCLYAWSHKASARYDYILFTLMYIVPLLVLTSTYIPICIRLWFHRVVGEVTRAQAGSIRSKRRAVKMLCVVMVVFAICWLPYHLFFLIMSIYRPKTSTKISIFFILSYWLAMSNSLFNPIVYFTMNRRFRAGLAQVMLCLACKSSKTPKVGTTTNKQSTTNEEEGQDQRVTATTRLFTNNHHHHHGKTINGAGIHGGNDKSPEQGKVACDRIELGALVESDRETANQS